MNNRSDAAPTDYIGLLGKDPKTDSKTAIAWREMRDMVVHGPRNEFTFATKPRLWPWQWSSVTSKRWSCSGGTIGANLPKGGGKTEYMRRLFESGETMGLHGYMNYPGMLDEVVSVSPGGHFDSWEPKEHQRESLAQMAQRFASDIQSVRGRLPARVPVVMGLDTALPMGFGNLNQMLTGGIPLGSWHNQPMHVPLEIRAKTTRNWPIQATNSELWLKAFAEAHEGKVYIDLEADIDLPNAMERLRRHVDGFVIDSIPKKRGSSERQLYAFDYKMGVDPYIYDTANHLTQMYEKARKKFKHFKHKDAVNYLVKREKRGRKWIAQQLEEIGAAYEKKERDELREKARAAEDAKWKKQYGDFM